MLMMDVPLAEGMLNSGKHSFYLEEFALGYKMFIGVIIQNMHVQDK